MLSPTFLGFSETLLQARGGLWTAREIAQQPQMLRETQKILMAHRARIEAFLQPLLARADVRVILTGAGTSAFIGESLAPWLAANAASAAFTCGSNLTCVMPLRSRRSTKRIPPWSRIESTQPTSETVALRLAGVSWAQ